MEFKKAIEEKIEYDDIRCIYNEYKSQEGKEEELIYFDKTRHLYTSLKARSKDWRALAEKPLSYIAEQYLEKGSVENSVLSKKLDYLILGLDPYDPLLAVRKDLENTRELAKEKINGFREKN